MKGGRSYVANSGIISNRQEADMTSVGGLSEHDSVGGYGRGSGHTFLVPSVVNSGRESG